jgi:hypothetical protein
MVDNRKAQNDVVTMLLEALLKPKPTHDDPHLTILLILKELYDGMD